MTEGGPHWVALESSPAMLTSFAHKIGANKEYGFSDCFGLDPELLEFCPKPVLGFVFLYPCQELKSKPSDAEPKPERQPVPEKAWFMKQLVGNACGSIAVLHNLMNNRDSVSVEEGSFLDKFYAASKTMTTLQR